MTPDRRALTPSEQALVSWLVAHGRPAAADYAGQLARLRVRAAGRCRCGCPSLAFALEGDAASDGDPVPCPDTILADAFGRSPEGLDVAVILWAAGGRIAGLEVYSYGDAPRGGLPLPAELVPEPAGLI